MQSHQSPLPMTPEEIAQRGWDAVDVVFVTGDAYVDHPSFAAGLLARVLEAEGFRVAVLSQPDWHSAEPWRQFGRPRVCFAVSAGNMDSMINHYTAARKVRNDDAYSPGGRPGRRPDRATLAYCQRSREAFRGVPVIAGGVEASLRRISHYDYWSDKLRRSILLDAKPDLLVHGMGEQPLIEIVHRLAAGEPIRQIRDVRGTAYRLGASETLSDEDGPAREPAGGTQLPSPPGRGAGNSQLPSPAGRGAGNSQLPSPAGRGAGGEGLHPANLPDTSAEDPHWRDASGTPAPCGTAGQASSGTRHGTSATVVELPSHEQVVADRQAFIEMTRLVQRESDPESGRTLLQRCGSEAVVINPPAPPLQTARLDRLHELPFTRRPHPSYGDQRIPAYEVVKNSVQIMRGCFGGCSFCSLAAHQGRIVQSRSERSILDEVRRIAAADDFSGTISDLGGPTANMYRMNCTRPDVRQRCHRPSCLHPEICTLLDTDHRPLLKLMQAVRRVPGVRHAMIASGVRMDLAQRSKPYIAELARHHTGGLLKVAPEHSDPDVLRLMHKPETTCFESFRQQFHKAAERAGRELYLVPYFMAGHPGCDLDAMIRLAEYMKRHHLRPEQVQEFIPAPMDLATAAYYTGIDPMSGQEVYVPRGRRERRLQRALLQYFKGENYRDVRAALEQAGREDLIGDGPRCLIPARGPAKKRRRRRSG